MSNQVFCWNNYVIGAALLANSAALPVDNLRDLTGSPSMAWQTAANVRTAAAGAVVRVTPSLSNMPWRAFGVFRTNLTAVAAVTFTLTKNGSVVWGGVGVGATPGYGQIIVVAPNEVLADYLTVSIDDPSNPDGFINIPLMFAGPAWQMQTAADWSSAYGLDDQQDAAQTRGGQEYSVMRWSRRRWELSMVGIRTSEASAVTELNRVSRTATNILFCPDITSDDSLHTEAVFGRLTATADLGYPYAGGDRRSWRARIQERL